MRCRRGFPGASASFLNLRGLKGEAMNRFARFAAPLGLLGLADLAAAQVVLPDATSQLTAISTSVGGYAAVMFLIGITSVGIMVGLKWIKRGKSAA